MISDLCDSLGADKHTVLNSIGNDSRIGTKYFKPGNSFGGPCFPRDTRALSQLLSQNNINSDILDGTTVYNDFHIDFQVRELLKENKDEFIIENVCYKDSSKIPIIEESAKLKIAKKLRMLGKNVIIKDTHEIIEEVKKEYGNLFDYSNTD
jgi:UDP-glucose 6-dehydrogenase